MNVKMMKYRKGNTRGRWSALFIRLRQVSGPAALSCLCLACLMSVACSKAAGPTGSTDSTKNVILITVDTLRADRLGCYGFPLPTSPSLDRFAEHAMLFERAYAHASSTCPSLAALMTSLMPEEAGVPTNAYRLNPPAPTLSQYLKSKGYTTAAFVSNFVLRRGKGFEAGFDFFDDKMPSHEGIRKRRAERTAEDTVKAVLKWLGNKSREPFFLWVHFQDPHGPYTPPEPYDSFFERDPTLEDRVLPLNKGNSGIGGIPSYQAVIATRNLQAYATRYLGEIRYFDTAFDTLDRALQKRNLYERSIVIFSADHGEGMGEHEYYLAHGEYLYDSLLHVPLLLRAPGIKPARVSERVSLSDIYPTVLTLLDFPIPPHVRGKYLLDAKHAPRMLFSSVMKTKIITTNRWAGIYMGHKLIFSEPGIWEYYDLEKDAMETRNLATGLPSHEMEEMKRRFLAFMKDIRKGSRKLKPLRLDRETEEKLKGLGYGF